MPKIRINMLSKATSVAGQGVGSAYIEMVALLKKSDNLFEIAINSPRGNFDIYHMHTINPTYRMRFNKKHVNVAYVHFLPSTLKTSLSLPKWFFKILNKYVINTYKKADEIVVVNPAFINPLVDLGIKKENITYIPNYVDHNNFKLLSAEQINNAKKEFGIPLDKFVVLGCGQIQTRKGVFDFVETAKRNPDKLFIWAGGFSFGLITNGHKKLKKMMKKPPENVKFLGIIKREKMNEIFNLSDVLFMPSFEELFPMSILEMANCYKPVLLRDLSLYEEILFYDKDCYAKGNGIDEFDEQINKLAVDKNYYRHYQEGSKYISSFYNKDYVFNIWKDYYPRILNKWQDKKKIKP